MIAPVRSSAPGRRQRVASAAAVSARRAGAASVLGAFDQRGGAKIRLPRSDPAALEAVLINTAGGLTGGDAIDWRCEAEAGARLIVTTAAAEKLYRSDTGTARQSNALTVGSGARLDWLPQETILFDGGALERTLEVDLATDATLLAVEPVVFGRHAMGERVVRGTLRDRWRIRRGGRLLHAEDLFLDAERDLALGSPSGFGPVHGVGYRAALTAVLCSPADDRAHDHLVDRLRASLTDDDAHARVAVSALPGRVVLRAVATDGHTLRTRCLAALERLHAQPLPRVWHV